MTEPRAKPASGKAGAARNRVRIIGGAWRSRILRFHAAQQLRPTPDRVRETLFNWLGQRLDGLACLDLFAGSGALGFEALSRGAARAVMVERDRGAVDALRENASLLGARGADIVASEALRYLDSTAERFDIAFLDPPYGSGLLAAALERLPRRLNPGARVYVESDTPMPPPQGWQVLREDRAGAVRYALFGLVP